MRDKASGNSSMQRSCARRARRLKFLGPERIVAQLAGGDAVGRFAAAQMAQDVQQLLGDLRQARLQLERLFVLGNPPAPGIGGVEQRWVAVAIGFPAQARGRHEFGVGGDGIISRAGRTTAHRRSAVSNPART